MTGEVADSGEALLDREPPVAADMWAITRGCAEMLMGPVKAGSKRNLLGNWGLGA